MSSTDINKQIEELVTQNKVVLFMKGSKSFPQCGFSSTVVQILGGILDDFATVNVLSDPDIRSGIKEYSDWPTIPQLYINGEFVGGCDIVKQMFATGDLHKALGVEVEAVKEPSITITKAAMEQLKGALGDGTQGDTIHIAVDMSFHHDLSIGPEEPGNIRVQVEDLTVCFDPASARRSDGLVIDYITDANGDEGFKLDNPNAS